VNTTSLGSTAPASPVAHTVATRGTTRIFDRFHIILGVALAALVVAVFMQQAPGWWRGPMTPSEIDGYISKVAKLPLPAQERDEVLKRVRAFAAADDGRPLYMLNTMRYFPALKPMKGVEGFKGTPAELNAKYEAEATPLLLKLGASATFAGNVSSRNLFGFGAAVDDWSRILVIRYPSRRAFLDLMTDPAYEPLLPYKLASLDVLLTPTEVDQIHPEYRLAAVVIALLVFVTVGWWRAARRRG
jgi:hypothetical protein